MSRAELNQQANTDGGVGASHSQQDLKVAEINGAANGTGKPNDLSTANSTNATKNADASPRPSASTEKESEDLPALPFQFHLNLPHPVPTIGNSDIKQLTAQQRI